MHQYHTPASESTDITNRPGYTHPGGWQVADPNNLPEYPGDKEMAAALGLDFLDAQDVGAAIESDLTPDLSVTSVNPIDDDFRAEVESLRSLSDIQLASVLAKDGTCWLTTEAALLVMSDRNVFRNTVADFGGYSTDRLESIMDPENGESATCREAAKHVLMGRSGYWAPWCDDCQLSTLAPIPAFVESGWSKGVAVMSEAELAWLLKESDGLGALDAIVIRELMHRSGGAFTLAA